MVRFKKTKSAINDLRTVMAALRSPGGCPWDREQDHMSLRFHAVEEVYELIDAIEAGDEEEMIEELGDLLLQVVFHCQLGAEKKRFDLEQVARRITEKLVRRHPHVFGETKVETVDGVWAQWDKIKLAEKAGTGRERKSALDGIPAHLPALMRAEKIFKKAAKAGLVEKAAKSRRGKKQISAELIALVREAQSNGISAEELLRNELKQVERELRRKEARRERDSKNSGK